MTKEMNKKVKTLSSLRVQLIERVKLAKSDKSRVMAIVKEKILTEVDLDEATQAKGCHYEYGECYEGCRR